MPLPPPKRRCVGKTKQSDAMIVPQHIKDLMSLRESNRKKGPGRPKKQAPQDCEAIVTASNQDPPGKKGNDSEKAKTARDGKQSVISIWDKMKLFEETRLPIYMHIYINICICIYIYIHNICHPYDVDIAFQPIFHAVLMCMSQQIVLNPSPL